MREKANKLPPVTIAAGKCLEPDIIAGDMLHWNFMAEPKIGDIVAARCIREAGTFTIAKRLTEFCGRRYLESNEGFTTICNGDEIIAVLDHIERPKVVSPELRLFLDGRQRFLDEYRALNLDSMLVWWSVYSLETGLFTGQRLLMRRPAAILNTPSFCGIVEGKFDPVTQRVDLNSRQVTQTDAVDCTQIGIGAATETYYDSESSVTGINDSTVVELVSVTLNAPMSTIECTAMLDAKMSTTLVGTSGSIYLRLESPPGTEIASFAHRAVVSTAFTPYALQEQIVISAPAQIKIAVRAFTTSSANTMSFSNINLLLAVIKR